MDFLQPILDEHLEDFPEVKLLLRGDSGFATPSLYKQCEKNSTGYVIRLKENAVLRDKASYLADKLDEITKNNKLDYAVVMANSCIRQVLGLMKDVLFVRWKSLRTK